MNKLPRRGSSVSVASHAINQKCDSSFSYCFANQRVRKAASSLHLSFYVRNYSTSQSLACVVKTYKNYEKKFFSEKLKILKENRLTGAFGWKAGPRGPREKWSLSMTSAAATA